MIMSEPVSTRPPSRLIFAALIAGALGLTGCDRRFVDQNHDNGRPVSSTTQAPYVAPTAVQLTQLVAPIALYPDKLLAQVLAASTNPDQIVAASQWRKRNAALKPGDMAAAASVQHWDVSVQSLTAFPAVLDQLANNDSWSRALGDAYVNNPADVMNTIQLLRQQAHANGNLRSSPQLRVAVMPRTIAPDYVLTPGQVPAFNGHPMTIAPPQVIVIESPQPDVVYVPRYDPQVVYGKTAPFYPGYTTRPRYDAPYSDNTLVVTGVLSFGTGILIGAFSDHERARQWHAWDMHWGDGRDADDGGWHRPAVVYNNTIYTSRSTTIVNRVTNNIVVNNNTSNNTSSNTFNRVVNNNYGYPSRDAANNNLAQPNWQRQIPVSLAAGATGGENQGPNQALMQRSRFHQSNSVRDTPSPTALLSNPVPAPLAAALRQTTAAPMPNRLPDNSRAGRDVAAAPTPRTVIMPASRHQMPPPAIDSMIRKTDSRLDQTQRQRQSYAPQLRQPAQREQQVRFQAPNLQPKLPVKPLVPPVRTDAAVLSTQPRQAAQAVRPAPPHAPEKAPPAATPVAGKKPQPRDHGHGQQRHNDKGERK